MSISYQISGVCQDTHPFVAWISTRHWNQKSLTGITKVDTHIRQKHFDSHYDYRANMPQFKDDAIDQNQKLLDLVKMTAEKKNATPAQISLAWMLCKKPYIVPIPGSRKIERMRENFASAEVTLTQEEVKKLDEALDNSGMSAVFGGTKIESKK